MVRKKTHEQFVNEINTIHNGKVNVINEYSGVKNKITVECKSCLYKWETTPNTLLNCGCPKCSLSKRSKSRTKSNDEFKKEIFDLVGYEYSLLSEYVKSNEKVLIRHNNCDYEYKVRPANFLNGKRCPKCSGKMKKDTDIFKEDVFRLVENEYSVIGEYINNQIKVEMLHHKCNKTVIITPAHFLSGRRCPYCAGKSWTNGDFKEFISKSTNDEYEILTPFIKFTEDVVFYHKVCKNKFTMKPSAFKHGTRCPICANNNLKTTELYKIEVENLVGYEYQVLGEYTGANNKTEMLHSKCKNKYNVSPSDFLKGRRCPFCRGKKVSKDNCLETIFPEIANDWNYTRNKLSPKEYLPHSNKKVWWICKEGHEWEASINNRTGNGRGCPTCCESKGEKEIRKLLEKWNITFKPQFTYDNLIGINRGLLKFDFAVFDNDKSLNFLIEYDGIFHYEKQYENDGHERLAKHDKLKNEYCDINKIKLIRIPYWEFNNIEEILCEEIEKQLI